MRSRPVSLARRAVRAGRSARPAAGRLRRLLLGSALVLLLGPGLLLVIYRFVPVPITPLMVIRLIQGQGLQRDWVALDDMAPVMAEAVIAGEDNLFCEHWGFDWQALRGEIAAYREGERPRGASTITMQTAKNLFLWPGRNLLRKALEAWLTPQIELLWPKRRIMEVYLNIVELGPGLYGAEAAARHYFGKPASKLTSREAALLAAILPNPLHWSPAKPTRYLSNRARTIRTRIGQLGPMLDCVRPQA